MVSGAFGGNSVVKPGLGSRAGEEGGIAVILSANDNPILTQARPSQSGLPTGFDGNGDFHPSASFDGWQGTAKRVFDVTAASAALVFLAPLMLFVALAIRLESNGPVLFGQEREGKNKVPFRALKFRSMEYRQCDTSGVRQTMRDDPRVTRVGRFLRRTSIDELPQLINIIRGHMSLVGPRPHVPGMLAAGREYRDLVVYYDLRLLVRPGLTGWAQANGFRGPTTNPGLARARIDHDLAYIQNFSFWLDLKIILLTIGREFILGSGD